MLQLFLEVETSLAFARLTQFLNNADMLISFRGSLVDIYMFPFCELTRHQYRVNLFSSTDGQTAGRYVTCRYEEYLNVL